MTRHEPYIARLMVEGEVQFCKNEGVRWPCDCEQAWVEVDRLRRVLAEIATIDYRGNRSTESSMAYAALASERGPLRDGG
jgi:hypothetical protein